ncbi:F-box protein 7 [Galdieria sulphuraria]|uniref:F-box protein isoform 1 n=1 Tax=Galdieria sulphuraria TaxID=130081 RepID=M2W4H4_GALSU|nr:F-box protein isoform 1 [Galdieria sulphuraria]EME30651.1 F-box protein isoform 1 [Galdieria sulphuraria]GJD09049.1 F-box protein 7 [Galdieria sulphuraria]|eukprot:XP_005707171.1 F-box protein isoform 1 [Galdieria sulphuraria]
MVDYEPRVVKFHICDRPWLSLYNRNLILKTKATDEGEATSVFNGPSGDCLSDDVMYQIFARLSPSDLAACSRVCRRWNSLSFDPAHWKRICMETWPSGGNVETMKSVVSYGGSWRRMFLERPHLRFDGVYISRHQYIRMGLTEGKYKQPVFLVTYFRFLRFYPDGICIVLTSAEKPTSAVKRLRRNWSPSANERDKATPCLGSYEFNEKTKQVTVISSVKQPKYPEMRDATVVYSLKLSSTCRGANDRLYVESHFSIHEGSDCPVFHSKDKQVKYYSFIAFRCFHERCARLFHEEDYIKAN